MVRPDGRASARKSFVFLVMGMAISLFASVSYGDVPHMINYQGKLTTASGGCLNDTVQMIFTIYSDSLGTSADWTETQTEVVVKEGIFNVLLGAVDTIPQAVFDGSIKYLGVQVETDPEMRPLKPMVSVAYAYRAATTDAGGGVNCEDCDDRFVNVEGPDSVVANSGTAFFSRVAGSSSSEMRGIEGYAQNTYSGYACGGYFSTSSSGTGTHYGVKADGLASSTNPTYGVYGNAQNASTGNACGGVFNAGSSGTGRHYGVKAQAFGSSSAPTYGYYGWAQNNTSTGDVYGGSFSVQAPVTGRPIGVYADVLGYSGPSYAFWGVARDSLEKAYGANCWAINNSAANAYGGHFRTQGSGSGTKYGVYASATGSGSGTNYGVYASAPVDQGWAGYFQGDVRITDSLVVLGAKSAGVKVDNGEYRLLYSQESPEVWFEDFGEGQLVNGRAHIDLDPLFLETVTLNSQHPMKVFIQLTSGEPMNVVVHKGITGFGIVAEDISSNATFDYRVVAKRKGYENVRLAKMGGPTPEEVAAEQERHLAELQVERARMEQERMEMDKERESR